MLLANLNIQEFVTEQIKKYLSKEDPSFSELKSLILGKAPIAKVHASIVSKLTESKTSDLIKVQKALIKQAYKIQLTEDEQQKKQEHSEELKDKELKKKLNQQLEDIPGKISSYEKECRILGRKIDLLMESRVEVSLKPADVKKQQSSTYNEHLKTIDRYRSSIIEYEIKIHNLVQERFTILEKLSDLEKRFDRREEHHHRRTKRQSARIAYESSGEGVHETLSQKNQSLLAKGIQDQKKALEKKCSDLIQETEHINYAFFLEQLPEHLESSSQLAPPEVNALKAILKLMNQHLEYEHQTANTQDSLNKKRQFISSQVIKLQDLNSKLSSFKDHNPDLSASNKQLLERNIELKKSLEQNTAIKQRLYMPSLLLFGLTLLFTIPFILAMSGAIPLFIAPALLYTLVSLPPALLLLGTVATGITALVYGYKASSNETEIKTNLQMIDSNTTVMSRNSKGQKNLQSIEIPSVEGQIQKHEALRETLLVSLSQTRKLADQTLKQATELEPSSLSSSPFLGKKKNNTNNSTQVPADELSETASEELDEAEESDEDILQTISPDKTPVLRIQH